MGWNFNQLSPTIQGHDKTFFKKILFSERGEGREKERERNINWLPVLQPLTRDQTRNPGVCPDWESNQQPFALQNNADQESCTGQGHDEIFRSGEYVHFMDCGDGFTVYTYVKTFITLYTLKIRCVRWVSYALTCVA